MDSLRQTNDELAKSVLTNGLTQLHGAKPKLVPTVPTVPTGNWIQTFSGGRYWPLNPRPEDVRLEDIAHSLSNQCRFAGHVRDFYSVAQHSVLVSCICDPADRMWGLLHDSPEAYMCDLPRPVKYDPEMGIYKIIEKRNEDAIVTHFGLPPGEPASVKAADKRLLFTERRDLLPSLEWESDNWGMGLEGQPLPVRIIPWTPKHAEEMFLKRYRELRNG